MLRANAPGPKGTPRLPPGNPSCGSGPLWLPAQPSAVTSITNEPLCGGRRFTPIHMPTRYLDRKFDSYRPCASLSKPPAWLLPRPVDQAGTASDVMIRPVACRPREVRLSTCAARLWSPPRGSRTKGAGELAYCRSGCCPPGHGAAPHVSSRSIEAPVRDGVRVLAARVDGPRSERPAMWPSGAE